MQNPFNDNAKTLDRAFKAAGFQIRLVGGAVRDYVRGVEPKDLDFCTDATPDQMRDVASANGFSFHPTGIEHGTVTLVVDHEPFEVTTLRVDTDTDGRHATVSFTTSFEADAARRDLTINAMSMDVDGTVFDYFEGQSDMAAQRLRFVGDAAERIREDFLRILRFFRFAARMGWKVDADTLKVIAQEVEGLRGISKERVWMEMSKLFTATGRVHTLDAMRFAGVFEVIGLPDFDAAHISSCTSDCAVVARIFSNRDVKVASDFCRSWKMSSEERVRVEHIHAFPKSVTDHNVKLVLSRGVPRATVKEAIPFENRVSFSSWMHFVDTVEIPVMPVKGQDLLDAGMQPGKEIGRTLSVLRDRWEWNNFRDTKESMMEDVRREFIS